MNSRKSGFSQTGMTYTLVGISIAFMVNYLLYTIFLLFALKGYLNGR
jgi:hypothetical protein